MITAAQIENEWFYTHIRHGNKGYPRDEQGNVIMRPGGEEPFHLGYAWTYRAVENPRVTYTHHIMHPDKEDHTTWAVDGIDVPDVAAVIVALSQPPLLTMAQYWAWVRMGPDPLPRDVAVAAIAGCANPTPGFLDGRWAQASFLISQLQERGLLEYDEAIDSYRRREQ